MSAPHTELTPTYRSAPGRRPRSDREVELPAKGRVESEAELFEGIFRSKIAERMMADVQSASLSRLNEVLAREQYLAATAAWFHVAYEVAKRIHRADLVAQFERARNDAIEEARLSRPMRVHTKKRTRQRKKA